MSAWSINDKCEVTKQLIRRHKDEYVSYVLSMKKRIDFWKYDFVIKNGAKWEGYNNFSVSCIPVSYKFFKYNTNKITKELERVTCDNLEDKDLEYINDGINEHNKKGKNSKNEFKNELSLVLHVKHVKELTLPAGVTAKDLIDKPGLLVDLINSGKIELNEYGRVMTLNLYIQFWQEKVKKRI